MPLTYGKIDIERPSYEYFTRCLREASEVSIGLNSSDKLKPLEVSYVNWTVVEIDFDDYAFGNQYEKEIPSIRFKLDKGIKKHLRSIYKENAIRFNLSLWRENGDPNIYYNEDLKSWFKWGIIHGT